MEASGARPEGAGVGSVEAWPHARERYVAGLLARFPLDLSGLRIALDCAHGATVATAPEVLERLGARLEVIGAQPDGVNINVGCGSTDLRALREAVVRGGHDLGLAFDGDGDRVLAVDGAGEPVDGDQILAILAIDMRARGSLANGGVVTTTMTNLGFRRAMAAAGIEVRWTDVGDRYVLEGMRAGGFVLGGEPSGHLINLLGGPTGDGLATALQLLQALARDGRTLAAAAAVVEHLPQKLVTIPVARKQELAEAAAVWEAVRACERALGEDGRVVVRVSGTEPAVRVMVEAPTTETCERWCEDIASAVVGALGVVA
jgi:phosphoglucosamine mutase